MNYTTWVGLTLKQAKTEAKTQLGVKKMGEARFQMLLDEGIAQGHFQITGDTLSAPSGMFDEIDSILEPENNPVVEVSGIRLPQPETLDVSGYPKDQLPRKGDLYYYQSYQGGVVQGEVLGVSCFADMLNPNGSFQSVSLTEMSVVKKRLPKRSDITAWCQSNTKLRAERDALLKEIKELKEQIAQKGR